MVERKRGWVQDWICAASVAGVAAGGYASWLHRQHFAEAHTRGAVAVAARAPTS